MNLDIDEQTNENIIKLELDLFALSDSELLNFVKKISQGDPVLVGHKSFLNADKKTFVDFVSRIGNFYQRKEHYFTDQDTGSFTRVTNERLNGKKIGLFADLELCWHSNGNAREEGKTPEVTIGLYCVKPGDSDYGITGFCNTKKAYEDLPKYRKELVDDIEVRMFTRAFMGQVPTLHPSDGGYKLSEDDPEFEVFMKKQLDKDGNEVFWNDIEEIWKPLVINHPWANSKAIRWTPSFIIDWKSKSGKEYDSLELWDYLNSHVYQDKYTYFHKWNSGDWIWMDQWTSVHNRSEVKGDRSLYRFCVDNKNIVDY